MSPVTSRLLAALGLALPFAAHAAMPADAPYLTDHQNLWVQDQTSDGISSLNMVLCVVNAINPGAMVNTGPYLALVDMNKCQSKGGGSATSAGATNYANAVVDATRASSTDPMIAKVWITFTEEGATRDVYAWLSASQSPTDAPPYGVFHMDYIGKQSGMTDFQGSIDAAPGAISFLETGSNSSNTALAMSATSTSAGAGTMQIGGGNSGLPLGTFNFAYDPAHFRRSDGTNDVCFDRALANAKVAIWQYGTYRADDGSRVDLAHPGIPLKANDGTRDYFGFGNYWGINFQGLSIPDGQPVAGITVSDQRPGNTTSYALNKVGGKLTRWTEKASTLAALDGIPVNVWVDLTGVTSGNPNVSGAQNWVLQWNDSAQQFSVVGTQNCGSNGCVVSALNPPAVVNPAAIANVPLNGWADSYGGNLNIPPTGSPHGSADPVYYFEQSTVLPGSTPLALYCVSQCPTAAQLSAFSAGSASTTPFGNGTDQQWFSAPSIGNTVSYSFGSSGLTESGVPMVLEQASQFPQGSPYTQFGLQTGWLFDTPPSSANCPSGMGSAVCQPASPSVYYTWQTGPAQWNQSLWLSNASGVVPFDPPQNIAYTVPTGSAYGSYAGKPLLLQFDGFGNLNGIPGNCFDPVSNAPEDCSVQNARYLPAFSIPDGTSLSLPASGGAAVPLLVKGLSGNILLAEAPGQCGAMSLSPQTLPSGPQHDPSSSADSEYLGAMPTGATTPKVIDGVVQN